MIPEEKPHVTIDDLLRLKRLERPAPEFWEEFDRELRAKQLAALVERRSWWRDLHIRFAGLRRYHLPLGATAVLAITFVTVRNYEPAGVEQSGGRAAIQAGAVQAGSAGHTGVAAVSTALGDSSAAGHESLAVAGGDYSTAETAAGADLARDASAAEIGTPSQIPMPWAPGIVSHEMLTPSAREIAANLAAAEAAEPAVVRRLLGVSHEFELGRSQLRTAVEPLQQMPSPAEMRLARFDSPLARTASLESPARNDGRVARDLDVYERAVRRIGGGGDRLTVKF